MQFVRFAGTAEGLQRFAHPVIRQLQTAGLPPLLRIHPEALPLEESPGRFADLRRDPHGPRLPGEPFDGGIERRGHSAPLEILVDEEHVHIPLSVRGGESRHRPSRVLGHEATLTGEQLPPMRLPLAARRPVGDLFGRIVPPIDGEHRFAEQQPHRGDVGHEGRTDTEHGAHGSVGRVTPAPDAAPRRWSARNGT